MSITVQHHQHDPAVVLEGADGQKLMMQTGTLIFEFSGFPDEERWVRSHLTFTVLELPPDPLLFSSVISAIATAAPCSMSYSPPDYVAVLEGSDIGVVVGQEVPAPGPPPPRVLPGGWAVDQTRATLSINRIQLEVDLAVMGHCSLTRLAYSVSVTITPPTKAVLKKPPILNP